MIGWGYADDTEAILDLPDDTTYRMPRRLLDATLERMELCAVRVDPQPVPTAG